MHSNQIHPPWHSPQLRSMTSSGGKRLTCPRPSGSNKFPEMGRICTTAVLIHSLSSKTNLLHFQTPSPHGQTNRQVLRKGFGTHRRSPDSVYDSCSQMNFSNMEYYPKFGSLEESQATTSNALEEELPRPSLVTPIHKVQWTPGLGGCQLLSCSTFKQQTPFLRKKQKT